MRFGMLFVAPIAISDFKGLLQIPDGYLHIALQNPLVESGITRSLDVASLKGLICFYSCILILQNPSDCSSARKLVCQMKVLCGNTCMIHHAIGCVFTAFGTNRTLISLMLSGAEQTTLHFTLVKSRWLENIFYLPIANI